MRHFGGVRENQIDAGDLQRELPCEGRGDFVAGLSVGLGLRNEGHLVNEKRIRRLMRRMPIFQKPNTSKSAKGHKSYPYLLRGLPEDRPKQVWCSDMTYLPTR